MDPLWSQWTLSSAEGCHETTSFQSPKKRKISFHSCKSNFSGSSSSIGNDVMLCISQLGLKTYDIAFYAPNISWDCFIKKCLISPWGQSWERVLHKHKCIQITARVPKAQVLWCMHEWLCKTHSRDCPHGEVAFSNSNINKKTMHNKNLSNYIIHVYYG